ncbi:MAG TPA: glycosyltransferase family 1 protein [Candidatus Sulfotelmatobacter sp.]|nr:glycosyltransferase family 1 protein [Candidatus Sulfotelmatobacter sp.]
MKVAIDTISLTKSHRYSGTGVYLRNLMRECLRICEIDALDFEFHGFVGTKDNWHKNGLSSRYLHAHKACALEFNRLWLLGGMALRTARVRPDLVFLPTAQSSIPPPIAPIVATILDAIPRKIPSLVAGNFGMRVMTWVNAKLTNKIITISQWSKQDLIELYGVDPEKVRVIYLGYDKQHYNDTPADPDAARALFARLGVRQPFVLHHGMVQVRKNVHRLVQAWELLRQRCGDLEAQLVLAGPMGFGHEEILRLREVSTNPGQIILTGPLTDPELSLLVKNAFLCVIPSLYEGFCLPMVESMACGVPTITSNSSCLPEVSGGVLEYFDPLSLEEMSCTIQRALEDSELRERLRRDGLARASAFSWERCAHETLQLFTEIDALARKRATSALA